MTIGSWFVTVGVSAGVSASTQYVAPPIMTTRRNHDFTFYQNSLQVTKDAGFLQQFNSMGGTNTYLVENVIGTDSLKAKLASANTA